jgi:hypothetical protein
VAASAPESHTRKTRIDPRLDARGWRRVKAASSAGACRTEEHETTHGPADYALFLDGKPVAIVEAKKTAVDAENVLTQAERYGRGLQGSPFDFDGIHVPFLYSTNGEQIWFRDARHPLNRCRQVADCHTPEALGELLARDFDGTCGAVLGMPNGNERLRPYQRQANTAVERAISERKRALLLAMATGTGKTFTIVNQIYRLMKAGVAKRVLFLVDRRALAAQAVRAFRTFDAEPGQKFNQVYEVYSNRFQREDFDEDDKFDPTLMPNGYLTAPDAGHTFVYVCTIQRMAINVLGRDAIFGTGDEPFDTDVDRLEIPIHAFDLIVADECHRGYTAGEISVWRDTLNHFDAIKIGLTATPAKHTTGYFGAPVFHYSYEQAVANEGQYAVIRGIEERLRNAKARHARFIEAIACPGGEIASLVAKVKESESDVAALEAQVAAANRAVQSKLVPRPLGMVAYQEGQASMFSGDVAKDRNTIDRLVDSIVVSEGGQVMVNFRAEGLFGPALEHRLVLRDTDSARIDGDLAAARRRALESSVLAHSHARLMGRSAADMAPITQGGDVSYWLRLSKREPSPDDDEDEPEADSSTRDIAPKGPVFPAISAENTVCDPNGPLAIGCGCGGEGRGCVGLLVPLRLIA